MQVSFEGEDVCIETTKANAQMKETIPHKTLHLTVCYFPAAAKKPRSSKPSYFHEQH